MIEFMVISGERSASTWASNWLTTDTTLCIHDPLRRYTLGELDGILPLGPWRKGISCTALQLAPGWLNAHPARKVILHRPETEIAASWQRQAVVPQKVQGTTDRLTRIEGWHCSYLSLFNESCARTIAEYLEVPFDAHRHAELVQMNIQPHWLALSESRSAASGLQKLIREST